MVFNLSPQPKQIPLNFILSCLVGLLFLLTGCGLQKKVSKNKPLLSKTKVKNAPEGHKYKLKSLIQQKPNSRFLKTFRVSMWTYLLFNGDAEKDSAKAHKWFVGKFWKNSKQKIRKGMGEKPVYMDSNLVKKSAKQMEKYLLHQGYFKSNVNTSINIKNQNARVIYDVKAKKPKRIGSVNYYIPDKTIYKIIQSSKDQSLIQQGKVYSSQLLSDERERITNLLNNKGYFNFSRQNIQYKVDTSVNENEVSIGLIITNPKRYERYNQYKIKRVYIEPDYNFTDTVPNDTIQFKDYHFIFEKGNKTIKPESILRKIDIKPGKFYSAKAKQKTYDQLSQLAIFKFIDIRYRKSKGESDKPGNLKYLDCHIQLTKKEQLSLNIEWEFTVTEENEQFATFTNNSRFYGFAPLINFRNRNLFKRGISWDLNFRGGYEFSGRSLSSDISENIYEVGVNTNLEYYGSFLPQRLLEDPPANSIKTSPNLTYLIEGNPNYQRTTFGLGHRWEFDNPLNRVYFTPLSINLVNTRILNDSFRKRINNINNPFIESIFDRYTLIGSKLTGLYNDRPIKGNQYWLIKWLVEPAGNLLYLYQNNIKPSIQRNVLNTTPDTTPSTDNFKYTIGDIGFYTYTKTKADFRHYISGSGENEFIFRFSPGIGFAYGNNEFMPFEKRFFVGGSNSIRAWTVREIGPGSFNPEENGDNNNLENFRLLQVGDILLEGNFEYRFKMVNWLNGAFFIDYGNVWTLREDPTKPGGQIEEDFYKEIALGTGYGFRFDFQFFVIRVDIGWPIRSPLMPEGSRWVAQDITLDWAVQQGQLNFGIGYPF